MASMPNPVLVAWSKVRGKTDGITLIWLDAGGSQHHELIMRRGDAFCRTLINHSVLTEWSSPWNGVRILGDMLVKLEEIEAMGGDRGK